MKKNILYIPPADVKFWHICLNDTGESCGTCLRNSSKCHRAPLSPTFFYDAVTKNAIKNLRGPFLDHGRHGTETDNTQLQFRRQ